MDILKEKYSNSRVSLKKKKQESSNFDYGKYLTFSF